MLPRLAARALVDERAAFLGRLFGRRRARTRAAESGPGRRRLPAATTRARRVGRSTRSSSRWHFPNRTPDRCGWDAPAGEGGSVIGNYYCTRFADAWEAARYTAANLARLEARTRLFAEAIRESTLPAAVKDGAIGEPLDAGHADLLPHRRRRVPRLRGVRRHRAAAAKATARTSGTTRRRPRTCSRALRARCAAPPSATRWTRTAACASARCCPTATSASGHGRGRRPDGPDHEGLSGLAAVGRRRVPRGALAAA